VNAIDLRLGQGVRPLLLDRVLGGEHEEGLGERVRLVADGHLVLLHGFEERALDLCGRTVDLVGEDDLGEDRAPLRREGPVARAVDEGADQVGGQQVGGELDAAKRRVDRLCQRLDGGRLGEPGDAFEEDVPVREQSDQQSVDQIALTDDHVADLLAEAIGERRGVLDAVVDGRDRGFHRAHFPTGGRREAQRGYSAGAAPVVPRGGGRAAAVGGRASTEPTRGRARRSGRRPRPASYDTQTIISEQNALTPSRDFRYGRSKLRTNGRRQ
jgi:hypothetical protein